MTEHGIRLVHDDLSGVEIQALLALHAADMERNSPPGSCHYFDLAALGHPSVSFWSAWDADQLAGCGALHELSTTHGEVKSMRTAPDHLGRGVGRQVLAHIIDEATSRGYRRLSLETGSGDSFLPACTLYESVGFESTEPFGDYVATDSSRFYTLELR